MSNATIDSIKQTANINPTKILTPRRTKMVSFDNMNKFELNEIRIVAIEGLITLISHYRKCEEIEYMKELLYVLTIMNNRLKEENGTKSPNTVIKRLLSQNSRFAKAIKFWITRLFPRWETWDNDGQIQKVEPICINSTFTIESWDELLNEFIELSE